MIDTIKLVNETTNNRITLSKEPGNLFMLETDGITWGEVKATHNTYVNLTGIGNTITSTQLDTRTIAIVGRVCCPYTIRELCEIYGISTQQDIEEAKLKEIEAGKKLLSQIVNPLHYVKIEATKYYIQGKPTSSVTFSNLWKENNEIYCKFTFSLNCNDPLFRLSQSKDVQLSGIFGGMHFPWILKKNKGIHFGIKKSYQLVNVNNTGDVALGGVIHMRATGPVVSPVLTNVRTQEVIKINKTLVAGEKIEVDTINRKILGAVDGENFVNYIAYWDFDNTWFQFEVGNTLFGFSTEDESYKNLEMYITLNKSYYSMEDQ